MSTPTPTAIEAAARAINEKHDFPAPLWESLVNSKDRANQHRVMRDRAYATAALAAAYPIIAAQAKAEALREAADEFGSWGPTGIAAANALRNRAATIEGKNE